MARENILPSVDDSSCSIYFNSKQTQQLTSEDVIGSQFETLTDAENFYGKYLKIIGFNSYKNDIRYNNNGETNVKSWVCNREGEHAKKFVKRKDSLILVLLINLFLNTYMS